mmetsp:Transcript_16424/g.62401  ORF Transcript_16424/g.62401 Transcript_16424/m.62401 type:complete len:115 (+) Transcript_16424:2133-2477(+)
MMLECLGGIKPISCGPDHSQCLGSPWGMIALPGLRMSHRLDMLDMLDKLDKLEKSSLFAASKPPESHHGQHRRIHSAVVLFCSAFWLIAFRVLFRYRFFCGLRRLSLFGFSLLF